MKSLYTLLFIVLNYTIYSQTIENMHYDISISLPDSMNYVKVIAKLEISNLKLLPTEIIKFDLCNGFNDVVFDSLSIFKENKRLEYTVKNINEIDINLPSQLKSKNTSILTFNYVLLNKPDFEKTQYSDFAFQSNKEDVQINAANTSTDNWIPKLHDAQIGRAHV